MPKMIIRDTMDRTAVTFPMDAGEGNRPRIVWGCAVRLERGVWGCGGMVYGSLREAVEATSYDD